MDHSPVSSSFKEELSTQGVGPSKLVKIALAASACVGCVLAGYMIGANTQPTHTLAVDPMFVQGANAFREATQLNAFSFGRKKKEKTPPPPKKKERLPSRAVPFQTAPEYLDGSMPGDVGFDPWELGRARIVDQQEKLDEFRTAEIKHGRLAMVTALSWNLPEGWKDFLRALGQLPDKVVSGEIDTPVVKGQELMSIFYWGALTAAVVGVELNAIEKKENGELTMPGDLGWDPLNLFREGAAGIRDEEDFFDIRTKEIKNGRLAMLSVLIYAIEQALSNPNAAEAVRDTLVGGY